MEERKIINELPVKTWNWLKMNNAEVSTCFEESKNSQNRYYIKENQKELKPIKLNFYSEKNMKIDNENVVYASRNSEVTVIMVNKSEDNDLGTSVVKTRLYAGINAKIHLIQIQLLNNQSTELNDIEGKCEEGAGIDISQLILGGKDRYYGCKIELLGNRSFMNTDIVYSGQANQKLDMNYIAEHKGIESKSRIKASGNLNDDAYKIFRGTIDFKRGASGSVGKENEEVLLSGDNVINKTIPLILCKEEDVNGSHGATIGRIDEETIFYLASRGINKEDAYKLIERSKINSFCNKIKDNQTKMEVMKYIRANEGSQEKDYGNI